jgi:hypothetical protein
VERGIVLKRVGVMKDRRFSELSPRPEQLYSHPKGCVAWRTQLGTGDDLEAHAAALGHSDPTIMQVYEPSPRVE